MTDSFDANSLIRLLLLWFILFTLLFLYKNKLRFINKKQIGGIFGRLIATYLVLFFLCHFFSNLILKCLFPLLTFFLNHLQNDYTANLSHIDSTNWSIKITITMLTDIPPFSLGVEFFNYFDLLPTLELMIVMIALVTALPAKHFIHRLCLWPVSLFASLIVLLLNVPFIMANQLETIFVKLASLHQIIRPEPLYHFWVQFLNQGGNVLFIILLLVWVTRFQQKEGN